MVRSLTTGRTNSKQSFGARGTVASLGERRRLVSQVISSPDGLGERLDAEPSPLLDVHDIEVVYSGAILAVRGVTLRVAHGDVVALLGANGAGKTTTLRAITSMLTVCRGEVTKGHVTFEGNPIDRLDPAAIVRRGISQVMEGRRIFAELTVDENLAAGAFTQRDRAAVK
jgi:branched-chain amino acid transport system ATP-binding protein